MTWEGLAQLMKMKMKTMRIRSLSPSEIYNKIRSNNFHTNRSQLESIITYRSYRSTLIKLPKSTFPRLTTRLWGKSRSRRKRHHKAGGRSLKGYSKNLAPKIITKQCRTIRSRLKTNISPLKTSRIMPKVL